MSILECHSLDIADVKVLTIARHGDPRGFFSETYNQGVFAEHGILGPFVQDNHSYSAERFVLRGLHYQLRPRAQAKLLRVTRGAILDVAVDIRRDSPSFGHHVSVVLSAQKWNQIWVPEGFAHGFLTLVPDTEVLYKVTAAYSPEHERGILWSDPALAIAWPVDAAEVVLSDKDTRHPLLADQPDLFDAGQPWERD
ncbi:MAG: dTDP-4-dehydrorhamnose 3,5-epimerase [Gammaproteobacteria bacterium]|nr:dTDP-4-dehydrorhamnose 3,5-epimerase [Gammaproteobacteria bacterium]